MEPPVSLGLEFSHEIDLKMGSTSHSLIKDPRNTEARVEYLTSTQGDCFFLHYVMPKRKSKSRTLRWIKLGEENASFQSMPLKFDVKAICHHDNSDYGVGLQRKNSMFNIVLFRLSEACSEENFAATASVVGIGDDEAVSHVSCASGHAGDEMVIQITKFEEESGRYHWISIGDLLAKRKIEITAGQMTYVSDDCCLKHVPMQIGNKNVWAVFAKDSVGEGLPPWLCVLDVKQLSDHGVECENIVSAVHFEGTKIAFLMRGSRDIVVLDMETRRITAKETLPDPGFKKGTRVNMNLIRLNLDGVPCLVATVPSYCNGYPPERLCVGIWPHGGKIQSIDIKKNVVSRNPDALLIHVFESKEKLNVAFMRWRGKSGKKKVFVSPLKHETLDEGLG